jgi:hydrogenase-4 component F
MATLLVLVPLALALAALATSNGRARPWIVAAGGVLQLALSIAALLQDEVKALGGWLLLDPAGRLTLGFTSVLFAMCALYVPGYLAQHESKDNRLFCASVLALIAMLTLAIQAHHLGLMWIAIETSTVFAAPLIYFHRTPKSLEATWKYLLVGSLGIALALLGSFFLGYAALHSGGEPSLLLSDLVAHAPSLSRTWLRAAFLVLLVGYGTKMGLAPMHTWKPDAYGEAPGIAGALLAGALTSGAFLAILRFYGICVAAGEAEFARSPMIALGIASMLVAAVFMLRQKDFKRMLAYSSVEHMGILMLGVGIGGGAVFGSLLHMVNNGLTKGVLFLAAGNIHRAFGSKSTDDVRGALERTPASAVLLLAGFFAVTGSPPFGPFVSELTILTGAIETGRFAVAGAFVILLALVFAGMARTVLLAVQGVPPDGAARAREPLLTILPAFGLLALVLLLGLVVPRPLGELITAAAGSVTP